MRRVTDQVLQESLLVLREVEGLIKDALGLGAHDPLDIAHPSNLARIPKALLDAMQASTPPSRQRTDRAFCAHELRCPQAGPLPCHTHHPPNETAGSLIVQRPTSCRSPQETLAVVAEARGQTVAPEGSRGGLASGRGRGEAGRVSPKSRSSSGVPQHSPPRSHHRARSGIVRSMEVVKRKPTGGQAGRLSSACAPASSSSSSSAGSYLKHKPAQLSILEVQQAGQQQQQQQQQALPSPRLSSSPVSLSSSRNSPHGHSQRSPPPATAATSTPSSATMAAAAAAAEPGSSSAHRRGSAQQHQHQQSNGHSHGERRSSVQGGERKPGGVRRSTSDIETAHDSHRKMQELALKRALQVREDLEFVQEVRENQVAIRAQHDQAELNPQALSPAGPQHRTTQQGLPSCFAIANTPCVRASGCRALFAEPVPFEHHSRRSRRNQSPCIPWDPVCRCVSQPQARPVALRMLTPVHDCPPDWNGTPVLHTQLLLQNQLSIAELRTNGDVKTLNVTAKVQLLSEPDNRHPGRGGHIPSSVAALDLSHCKLSDFDVVRIVGAGSFGRVSLATHRRSGVLVAIKCLSKAAIIKDNQVQHVSDEKDMLHAVTGHPFIIALKGAFQDSRCVYIVMDFVPGGEFFTHLRDHGRLREEHARFYVAQVVLALEHLHSKGIAYRDLKPENLLIAKDGYVKLADFGFAKTVHTRTFTVCGTPDYLAPEVIKGQGHSTFVDWWSLGCVVHEMLSGFPPFYTGESLATYKKIMAMAYEFPPSFSSHAKDLISKLLTPDPNSRLGCGPRGVKEIKEHTWFKGLVWDYVHDKAYQAPYTPNLASADDTSNFDRFDNLAPLKHAYDLTVAQQQLFTGFGSGM
ncbi:MAG: hypothetical protein WDW38_009876 [Sanguina aurantia]